MCSLEAAQQGFGKPARSARVFSEVCGCGIWLGMDTAVGNSGFSRVVQNGNIYKIKEKMKQYVNASVQEKLVYL